VRKKSLSGEEIARDPVLSAAARFDDTAITHGRVVYGPVERPMFVRFLHREKLRAPTSMPPALGGAARPEQCYDAEASMAAAACRHGVLPEEGPVDPSKGGKKRFIFVRFAKEPVKNM
jgi:hypothetical protein